MKLLLAIVRGDHAADVTFSLNDAGFSVTRISTTGGFWRRGNATLLIGVDDNRVDDALALIDSNAGPEIDLSSAPASHPTRRATIFVLGINETAHY